MSLLLAKEKITLHICYLGQRFTLIKGLIRLDAQSHRLCRAVQTLDGHVIGRCNKNNTAVTKTMGITAVTKTMGITAVTKTMGITALTKTMGITAVTKTMGIT